MRLQLLMISVFAVILLAGCSSQTVKESNMVETTEWRNWRGPTLNGVSSETGLIESWSQEGENLIWKVPFIGRSTPIVMDGRVYVIGRTGEDVSKQEVVASYDAGTGEKIWEYRYNMRLTSVPFNRLGWASMVGDAETGYVYAVGSGAMVHCFDKDGKIIWKRSLTEEFGTRTGYGGRSTSPLIDEDLLITGYVSAGWGEQKPMKHRHFAFDKRTGETVWVATPSGVFRAPNVYTMPSIAIINGTRMLIGGNADGNVYAMKARTGEKVWEFKLSKRGMNSSVVVAGDKVFAGHSEENVDTPQMGRLVAINAVGSGDITKSNEVWRYDAEIGNSSPMIKDGIIYAIDNAAVMYALRAETGEKLWEHSIGTIGRPSPVWADGKIYVTETNGRFHILRPTEAGVEVLDTDEIHIKAEDRAAEIFGSVAIAYGRIYFTTEEGLYCLGDKARPFVVGKMPERMLKEPLTKNAAAAWVQVVPAELDARAGDKVTYRARVFDEFGRFIREAPAEWKLEGIEGSIAADGKMTFPADMKKMHSGKVMATIDGVTGYGRVRAFPSLPWTEDFESYKEGGNPGPWIGTSTARAPGGKYIVKTLEDGNKVLSKPPAKKGIQRHYTYFGPSDMKGYVIQVDFMDQRDKRRRSDIGLVSHGYEMDLMGKRNRLELRTWVSEYRIQETVPFKWVENKWYTMKMDVSYENGKALIRGKVWPRDEAEPTDWSISAEDPYPVMQGSPGIVGVSYTEHFYDNLKVMQK